MTKVLANWLKLQLPDIISENQSTFFPGRLISDDVIVAHELNLLFGIKNEGLMIFSLKLDMSKAYDMV